MRLYLSITFAVVTIVLSLLTQETKGQTNYCNASLCKGTKHIACNNNGAWASRCPKNPTPTLVTMTSALQKLILNQHNTKRNIIASGKLSNYKAATRMATMQWNSELAKLAALNVKQCQMKHDACRNTPTFTKSGQNLAYYSYSGNASSKTDVELTQFCINLWWKEYSNANMNYINKYPQNYSGSDIGHFTEMVQMKNTHVGCAIARFKDTKFNRFLIACNYATTNIVSAPVYVSGTAASGCKTGKNPQYPALCKIGEKYDL